MQKSHSSQSAFYGTTRPDEEKKLAEVRKIAAHKVSQFEQSAAALQEDLKSLREVYDAEDKEGLAQWFNTDARFTEIRNDLNRAKRACAKPYFGRIDIENPETGEQETFYIGKSLITDSPERPEVVDWRAPVSSVYYDHSLGECEYRVPKTGIIRTDLKRKRTYEIDEERLIDYYDSDVVANDDLLTKYLSKSKRNVLSEIIATIQQEQNSIIRKDPHHNMLVQGSAGSGKTTVAMHRISYILYNYDTEFKPDGFYIIGSNKILLNYITGVLPDLDVYGVRQMTMEELFVRLLYEDWNKHTMRVSHSPAGNVKASGAWFQALILFCDEFEKKRIPMEDIRLEQNGHVILSAGEIRRIYEEYPDWTLRRKCERLNDFLNAGLENELFGKFYSYGTEEKKNLTRRYKNWFDRYLWKDSVTELYDQFLAAQKNALQKGDLPKCDIPYVKNEPDLYDLACLAYLYKRLKETEVIQEASHVVIDEAQDFGITVYRSLVYCMSKCTFTVMGDVSQNIRFETGLCDWEELKQILLPNPFDCFGVLKKSYRNTVEISRFATDILRHGTFPIYPVEPIIRHGEEVFTRVVRTKTELFDAVASKLDEYLKKEYETIAVICKDLSEAKTVFKGLRDQPSLPVHMFSDGQSEEFAAGIYVLPIEFSKGLEFDAVIIFDASEKAYPKEDGYARLLYVAATRALHELAVFSLKAFTGLIKDPIPEARRQLSFTEDTFHVSPRVFEEDYRTNEEIAREQAKDGDRERMLRDKYGPEKITVNNISKKTTPKPVISIRKERVTEVSGVRNNDREAKAASSEFYRMPDSTSLTPIGHGKIDTLVRWVSRDARFVEITSNYGTMRIVPIAAETVRILFTRGSFDKIRAIPPEVASNPDITWNFRESRDSLQITLEKLIIVLTKKTGVLEFLTRSGAPLLTENNTLPRQYHGTQDIWWQYFAWGKKESLSVRGETDDMWKDLTQTARYISHGSSERPALIMSSKGYQLLIPGGVKTLACTIPSYGPYLRFDETDCIDYLFRAVR